MGALSGRRRHAIVTALFVAAVVSCAGGRDRSPREAPTWTEPSTGMTFVRIPAGDFTMGSPPGEAGREPQERAHRVTISRPFYLGAFEVTQAEWRAVMGTAPSWFGGDDRRPVERITWFDVQTFLERLAARAQGERFRLPTEAEWEYGCRAGTTTAYASGDAWQADGGHVDDRPATEAAGASPTSGTTRVGSFAPNAWGLFDMSGNVWEWTADAHCDYAADAVVDPVSRCDAPLKVIRGGSWYFRPDAARCAMRYTHDPADRGFSLGVRIVRELPAGR